MSLITQCPACSTLFKVVPDQLRVSQGWVRCGQCDEVFDANAHMRNLSADAEVTPQLQAQTAVQVPPNPPAAPVTAPLPEPETVPVDAQAAKLQGADSAYDWGGVLESSPQQVPPYEEISVDSFLEKSPQELRDPPLSELPSAPQAAAELQTEAPPFVDSLFVAEPASEYLKSASFMAAKPAARSQSVAARIFWMFVLLLLVAGLALQVLLQERDRLAATQPVLKPVLLALCEMAGCKVMPFKQIDAIVIDSSTFSKVQQDIYKLSVTLKNNAALEIAKPALELTLTDAQDQAIFRRVIVPGELGDKVVSLAAGEDVSWTVPVEVKSPEGAARIAGYRVLAFYP